MIDDCTTIHKHGCTLRNATLRSDSAAALAAARHAWFTAVLKPLSSIRSMVHSESACTCSMQVLYTSSCSVLSHVTQPTRCMHVTCHSG